MNPFSARYAIRMLPQIFNRVGLATTSRSSKTSQNQAGASWGKGVVGVVGTGVAVWTCGVMGERSEIKKDFWGLNGVGFLTMGRMARCETISQPLERISALTISPYFDAQLMGAPLVQIQLSVPSYTGSSAVNIIILCPDIKKTASTITQPSFEKDLLLLNQWINTVIPIQNTKREPVTEKDVFTIKKIFEEKESIPKLKHPESLSNQELLKLILEIKALLLKKEVPLSPLIDTLTTCIQSQVVQKNYEDQNTQPSLETLFEIRGDSSGVIHRITAETTFLGIDISSIEQDYYDLSTMKKCVTKCLECADSILSHSKTVSEIEKKLGAVSTDTIRNTATFNAVQIMWQRSAPNIDTQFLLGTAFLEVQNKHNSLMLDFFTHKQALYEKIQKEKLSQKDSGALLEKKHADIIRYVGILEKSLTQPWEPFWDDTSTSEKK